MPYVGCKMQLTKIRLPWIGRMKAWKLSASLLVQYNFDFDLELIEMSLRIYSCVSLIVPLSGVWFCCCLPSHIYHKPCPCPSQWQSCISSMRRIQAKHCRWIAKIKWYNTLEYFIINVSQCSTIFGSSRFTFLDSLHRIAFIFSPLPSSIYNIIERSAFGCINSCNR